MKTVLGIDPGAHGAIGFLDEDGGLLEVVGMPSTPQANGRTATSAPLIAGILARARSRVAFCEFVGARPTDAKVAAFAFGRARGVIEGCAGALVFLTSGNGWPRFRPAPRTRTWLAPAQLPDGRPRRIFSAASAMSTGPRPASSRSPV
jgi:hypothetical protein